MIDILFQTAIGDLQVAIEARIEAVESDLSGYKLEVDPRFTALEEEKVAAIAAIDTPSKERDEELQVAIDAKNVSTFHKNCLIKFNIALFRLIVRPKLQKCK